MKRVLAIILLLILTALPAAAVLIRPSQQQFSDGNWRIFDDGDPTKCLVFELSGITTETTRTITMPDSDVTLMADINDVLDALATLAVVADNEFVVGTGAGTYAHESGATARGSMGAAADTDVLKKNGSVGLTANWNAGNYSLRLGNLILSSGSITDGSGGISFGDENLSTTGTGGFGKVTVDDIELNGDTITLTGESYIVCTDDLILDTVWDVRFITSGDDDDYALFKTVSDVPRLTTEGDCNLEILPDGGTVLMNNVDLDGSITMDATETVDGVDISVKAAEFDTHKASDGSDHTYIDQAVTTTSIPALYGLKLRNAHIITPDKTLQTEYDWLKSGDRDGAMGALSYTNRRTLVLSPGTYTLSAYWNADTEHVDTASLTPGNPADTVVTCSDPNDAVIKQTAADVRWSGFTVINTAGTTLPAPADGNVTDVSRGMLIINEERGFNATISGTVLSKVDSDLGVKVVDSNYGYHPDEVFVWDLDGDVTAGWYNIKKVTDDDTIVLESAPGNSAGDVAYDICFQHSTYRDMAFYSTKIDIGAGDNSTGGIGSRGNMGGLYENLTLGNSGLRTVDVNIHDMCYEPNELHNVVIDNGEDANDLGGGLVGIPVTGHKIRPHSFVQIQGTTNYNGFWPIHSVATDEVRIEMPYVAETFGAADLINHCWLASHRIKARHITGRNYCYGGDMFGEFAGDYAYVDGLDYCFNGCTQWSAPMRGATIRYCTARDFSYSLGGFILQTTTLEHCIGRYACFAGANNLTYIGKFWGTGRWLKAESDTANYDSFGAGDYASSGKDYPKGFMGTASLRALAVGWQYGSDSDWKAGTRGGGRYDDFGTDAIAIKDCHPIMPTACTSNTNVWVLDSGHTFSNRGAAGTVTFALPNAIQGLYFTYVDVENGAGKDIYVDPKAADDITLTDNTTLANGFYRGNESDAYGLIIVECFVNGHWFVTKEVGTWMSET